MGQTYDLPGFTGDQTRGIRHGTQPNVSSNESDTHLDPPSLSAQRERDLDDDIADDFGDGGDGENLEGDIGGLVDYISELPVHNLDTT